MARVTAQDLRERVRFENAVDVQDAAGVTRRGWHSQLSVRAHFRYLRGGETVQAARLAGRQPIVVTIRYSINAAKIETDWRMLDAKGAAYNIRGIVPTDDRRWLEITVEGGVAI